MEEVSHDLLSNVTISKNAMSKGGFQQKQYRPRSIWNTINFKENQITYNKMNKRRAIAFTSR